MKPCVFCAIAAGEKEADLVYQSSQVLAFLDHRPLFPGHLLVIPRIHWETLTHAPPSELPAVMEAVRLFTLAMPRALRCQGTFVACNNGVSQSVPHLHWHVIPRSKGDGLKGFFWPRKPYDSDEHRQQVTSRLTTMARQEEILDFWFGPLENGFAAEAYSRRWFAQDPAFDQELERRFGSLVTRALQGDLQDWCQEPRGRLALLLLLDQFTRNLYRHTAGSFSGDSQAQRLCLEGLEAGDDLKLSPDERVFFYLPLEHGESHHLQALSLARFGELARMAPGPRTQSYADYAKAHADIIFRFGRYPHRNRALDRDSTPEEAEFLQQPNSSFW